MQWIDLLAGFSLYLILDGLVPFISPGFQKQVAAQMLRMADDRLRFLGLLSMAAGLLLLYLVRH